MSKYLSKQYVEAIRASDLLDSIGESTYLSLPQWVKDAVDNRSIDIHPSPDDGATLISLPTYGDSIPISPTDYIYRFEGDEHIRVGEKEAFESKYKEAGNETMAGSSCSGSGGCSFTVDKETGEFSWVETFNSQNTL